MNFFISDAMAQTATSEADPLVTFLPLILIFVVFYFLMIRPQMKRQKEHQQLVKALKKGDEVTTDGGMLGKIVEVGENYVHVDVADNTVIKIRRKSINTVLPKGTLKEA